ncbi:MAG: A24 family peptidase [gamma proteobacterium symbiont of Bathyaustriella thionipta]|nr:A24 family peptidase [gamma proteobacterium symbiont of Bathyaustriella thionipta]MCU7948711.1 A24 family peptidase [gamma proteobacterium symbiont of Bathyaustriella thionipta]MCU7953888.1 A24 family peptidase [gamma proteobacterium symbiont of Bathyaustriella thionipta]MCU7955016.1 A24 family peptidase [gamma proteobacterium symbiont of Bathyaustriella thionipta]MCU7966870.1 A24 family peptidase [gamma proteobacterium symbiont of Bathyaustriella thionipta]
MSIVDYLNLNPNFFLVSVFLLSLLVGSFLNVVIYRLPIMLKREWQSDCVTFLSDEFKSEKSSYHFPEAVNNETEPFNLSIPRSRCPACGHQITALENIPVISWLFLRAKCSQCGSAISIRYPIIELSTALLSVLVAYYFGVQWLTLALLFLTWALIALTMIDFDTQLLPDNITLPFLWLGLLISLLRISEVSLENSVIGAIAGYMSLWIVYQLFKLITGKEGMGFGDFKLLAVLGAWAGWQALPLILLLSALVGAVVGISLILFLGRDKNIPIPFGPYLAAAGFISLLWGKPIMHFYFNLVGL